jgi:hypothetical protein
LNVTRNYVLIVTFLSLLALSFNIENQEVKASRVIVQDEDEHGQNNDFIFTDENMKQKRLENLTAVTGNISNVTGNYRNISYIDIKNVKFLYDNSNGTIIADIVINKEPYDDFAEGTTYGMAININPFQNSSNPEIADADYLYRFIFNNGSWNKVLGIQHTHGEEQPFAREKLEPSNPLNAKERYIRMPFNTAKIGNPEEFQVQFFASTKVKINSTNYTLVDVVPWIEIPPSTVKLALDPEVTKVYPQDKKKVDIVLNTTSRVSSDIVRLCQNDECSNDPNSCSLGELSLLARVLNNKEFCVDFIRCSTYCWIFDEKAAKISPEKNTYAIHAMLITKDITPPSLGVTLTAKDSPSTGLGVVQEEKDISHTWHFAVGSYHSDFILSALDFPNKYPYIIGLVTSIGTFFFGLFLDKGSVSSKIKNFLNPQRGKEDNQAANGAAGVN